MPQPALSDLLDAAIEGAYRAGRRTLAYFQTGITAQKKADDTPVTIADREAEQIFRAYIADRFPDHAILGEEEGESAGADHEYRWILDPIDGTKAFVAGVPLYGTLVGLEVRGEPTVGVIYLPALNDMISAAVGKGCRWNNRACQVADTTPMTDAVLVTSSMERARARSDAWERLSAATYLQRTWGDAFGYALVATGRAHIMLDPQISVWDVAPMPVILREAGGRFSDWQGRETIHGTDGVATSATLYEPVLEILRSETKRHHD